MEMRLKFDNLWFSWIGTEVLHGAKFTGRAKEMPEGGREWEGKRAGLFEIWSMGIYVYGFMLQMPDFVTGCASVCLSVYWSLRCLSVAAQRTFWRT